MSTKLPPNWNKHVDPQGKRYYSNTVTRESSWTAPEGATGGSASVASTEKEWYSNEMHSKNKPN